MAELAARSRPATGSYRFGPFPAAHADKIVDDRRGWTRLGSRREAHGYQSLARKEGERVTLWTRHGTKFAASR
jgi:hypothetical protein